MRIKRIQIKNFRNFNEIDVKTGCNMVIIGENKVEKSNFINALRLVLDPSLPDSARQLRMEDFWDGLTRPLKVDDEISISVDIADFEGNMQHLAILADHLVEPVPMVARLTYVFKPIPGLMGAPQKESDYEFMVFGGDRSENRVGYEVRRRLPLDLIPALRDCEGDLARWTRSPLRSLLDNAAGNINRDELQSITDRIDEVTQSFSEIDDIKSVGDSVSTKLLEMVGPAQALKMLLRFSPSDSDRLIRSLRLFIDGGKRSISDASLGTANILYFALKAIEYEQLVTAGERDHTFLAIEEPEAHLHPNLQRLIFRNYLRTRGQTNQLLDTDKSSTVIISTHSPHIASVTPLRDFIFLRNDQLSCSTKASSTAKISLHSNDVADLERYIDVNRGELLFARGVILVEGDAEKFLIPAIAKNMGYDLDELGISICSISGTNFVPYLKLIGPKGLDIPYSVLTDFDPQSTYIDGTPRFNDEGKPVANKKGEPKEALCFQRILSMAHAIFEEGVSFSIDHENFFEQAASFGLFVNTHTLEVDLFKCGLNYEFLTAIKGISPESVYEKRFIQWVLNPDSLNPEQLLSDIEIICKGRFAQRLSCIILESGDEACPSYIKRGIENVAKKCMR